MTNSATLRPDRAGWRTAGRRALPLKIDLDLLPFLSSAAQAACNPVSLGGRVLRLALVADQELDGARRLSALVLVAMDLSRECTDSPAIEDPWLLAPDREGDLALDDASH